MEEERIEKKLVEYIAQAIVEDADAVKVTVIEGEKSTIVELRVAAKDMGKIIGQEGRIARSIRSILNAVSFKTGKRTVLEILD